MERYELVKDSINEKGFLTYRKDLLRMHSGFKGIKIQFERVEILLDGIPHLCLRVKLGVVDQKEGEKRERKKKKRREK